MKKSSAKQPTVTFAKKILKEIDSYSEIEVTNLMNKCRLGLYIIHDLNICSSDLEGLQLSEIYNMIITAAKKVAHKPDSIDPHNIIASYTYSYYDTPRELAFTYTEELVFAAKYKILVSYLEGIINKYEEQVERKKQRIKQEKTEYLRLKKKFEKGTKIEI